MRVWMSRLRVPVRVRLAALLFILVVVAGAAVLWLAGTLVVTQMRGAPAGFAVVQKLLNARAGSPPPGALVAPKGIAQTLNGPLTVKALPRSVPALARFRSVVESETLAALSVQSAISLGILAVLAAGAAWLIAGRALRPLQAITTTARSLSHMTLHERIRMEGPKDEIRDLADTFDEMLHRLETAFRSQRNFLANASHELRTPLAVQRTLIDVALADPTATAGELRDTLAAVAESLDEERQLIEGLLVLATSERGVGHRERLDLGSVVGQAVELALREPGAAGLTVRSALVSALVDGDSTLLARMVGNLLENAVRYNRPGGWVEVAMAGDGRLVRTTVANTGRIVPAEAVGGLFEPFRRLGDERTGQGVGLGLSIARAIAGAHGGTISATPREGGGLVVTLTLPVARPADGG